MAQGFRDGHGNGRDPLKTLALFNRHFRREDTRFCLLQLLRGDAPLNTICPLLFDHHIDAELTSRFFEILRCHVGMGDPGRTGGNADDRRGILRNGGFLCVRRCFQRRKHRFRAGRRHHARPELVIRQARRQFRQDLNMR